MASFLCRTTILPSEHGVTMASAERRHLERFSLRLPLRFRPLGLASGSSEHFTEIVNISRGGFFFVTSAPLQVGMPIEATFKMPAEVTGTDSDLTHCRARLVHAKANAFSDGRMGYGAEIESYLEPTEKETAKAGSSNPMPSPANTVS